ncbi:hypothetical protein L1987_45642 [Smallanthus sonchifolius]|uniref:Uncharacterized protein n=1 Tax=Smallanthus sonchifolius TaxID=185202 RepID=A0ACB9FYI5_9ASTR|nr:hypothetical protein L1987_45642 [Smallanthus sonchifolius]
MLRVNLATRKRGRPLVIDDQQNRRGRGPISPSKLQIGKIKTCFCHPHVIFNSLVEMTWLGRQRVKRVERTTTPLRAKCFAIPN